MVDKVLLNQCSKKQTRQPVSVPFLWEEKPGTPKKDWKPTFHLPVNPAVATPVKLTASIPFEWEEKPGKPLANYSHPSPEPSSLQLTTPRPISLLLPPPQISSCGTDNDDEAEQSDAEARSEESFSSAPSLLANVLVSCVAVSSAVPVQHTSLMENHSGQLQRPSLASETDSSTSSYATGTTSLVGATILEHLFPLLPPNSSFLDKVGCSHNISSCIPPKVQCKDFDRESSCYLVKKRPTTLGELIMMSRRRSYRRKTVQMQRQNHSMEFMKSAIGCCIFQTTNGKGSYGKWKRKLRVKLV